MTVEISDPLHIKKKNYQGEVAPRGQRVTCMLCGADGPEDFGVGWSLELKDFWGHLKPTCAACVLLYAINPEDVYTTNFTT